MEDNVYESLEKILNKMIDIYKLSKKEAEELKLATYNYDYESNEGLLFTSRQNVENLFTENDGITKIPYTEKQIKALARYIYETSKFYSLSPDKELNQDTKRTILEILNNNKNKLKKDKIR